jgi:hypothetical protein
VFRILNQTRRPSFNHSCDRNGGRAVFIGEAANGGVCFSLVPITNTHSMLSKAKDPLLCESSMVAENLQRMEKQDDAFKPTFETALKNSAATAIVGG